jgi:hypothetical protein
VRFLIDEKYHKEMLRISKHSPDCYVRPGEYLHHLYIEGVKYVVAPALKTCLEEAIQKNDAEALAHLRLHDSQFEALLAEAKEKGELAGAEMLGDAPPEDDAAPRAKKTDRFTPRQPSKVDETGLPTPFLFEMVLRTIYNFGRLTGSEIADQMCLSYSALAPIFPAMRKQQLIDMVGQKSGGVGDSGIQYEIKPPQGTAAVADALKKTEYVGPAPVPFADYVAAIRAQTIKNIVVTRRTIQKAFSDLVITDKVFNEIGPAVNSAQSLFLFGYPGNGKTSVAERITRLMGDDLYIPFALEAGGQIIKLFDPIVHQALDSGTDELGGRSVASLLIAPSFDQRWVRIKRPTIVVGGELVMSMLDLNYNQFGRFYEAPVHMKANGGIFMIDDFGRQQVRPMDLLNRWIVPLEKGYDYLTTVTGNKLEVPFDQLLIFSTNLDPNQLADEAFLRRIKFKIEIGDPDEGQWRQIWRYVCKSRDIPYDELGIDYLIAKWYVPYQRPFRMCQPRDILDQMVNIAKYNMEHVTFSPDLIDAGCTTYFVSQQKRDFGAKVRLE